MHPDTMRLIDRWAGVPLCFVTGIWSWIKSARKSKSDNNIKHGSPEIIVFIGLAEIGALVVAFPAIQQARKEYPKSRICFITSPTGVQTLKLMGFEHDEIFLMSTFSLSSIFVDLITKGRIKGQNQKKSDSTTLQKSDLLLLFNYTFSKNKIPSFRPQFSMEIGYPVQVFGCSLHGLLKKATLKVRHKK